MRRIAPDLLNGLPKCVAWHLYLVWRIVLGKEKAMKTNLVVGIVLMLVALPCYAGLYSSDFEDYTVGLTIQSQSSTWWSPGSVGVVAVDPLDGDNQVVDVSGGASTFWLSGYGVDDVTDPMIYVDMDLYISDTSIRTLTYALTDNDTSDVVYNAYGNGGAGKISYSTHDSGGWVYVSAPTVDATWMHIRYELDQANDDASLIIDGTPVFTEINLRHATGAITTNTSTFDVGAGTVLVDNISVTVPEPASCVLLVLGGWAALGRRNRK